MTLSGEDDMCILAMSLLLMMTVAVCYAVGDQRQISQGEYGEEWPLTVPEATLFCRHSMVCVETSGHAYPINRMAMSRSRNERPELSVQDLEEIWRISPMWEDMEAMFKRNDPSYEIGSQPPIRVSLSGLIQDGLGMCG